MEISNIWVILGSAGAAILIGIAAGIFLKKPGQNRYAALEEKERENPQQELLKLRIRLWEIEKSEIYGEFLDRSIKAFQILIGLETVYKDLTKEEKAYYYQDHVLDVLRSAIKHYSGEIRGEKLVLPEMNEDFNREKAIKEIRSLKKEEIWEYIDREKRKVNSGSVAIAKKNVVQNLGNIIKEMTEETRFPDENEIKKYAHTTKNILEKNGIYPMYHDDERLRDYPKLQQRFIKTDDRSVKYPGLFLRIKEEYVVFGAYIGTR